MPCTLTTTHCVPGLCEVLEKANPVFPSFTSHEHLNWHQLCQAHANHIFFNLRSRPKGGTASNVLVRKSTPATQLGDTGRATSSVGAHPWFWTPHLGWNGLWRWWSSFKLRPKHPSYWLTFQKKNHGSWVTPGTHSSQWLHQHLDLLLWQVCA